MRDIPAMLPDWAQRLLARIGIGDDLDAVRDRLIDALQQAGQLLAAQALNLRREAAMAHRAPTRRRRRCHADAIGPGLPIGPGPTGLGDAQGARTTHPGANP